jgi:hypothetical protein
VRIFADNDQEKEVSFASRLAIQERPGWRTAAKWEEQLTKAGARVDVCGLHPLGPPEEIKDLNDLVRAGYHDVDVAGMMGFWKTKPDKK